MPVRVPKHGSMYQHWQTGADRGVVGGWPGGGSMPQNCVRSPPCRCVNVTPLTQLRAWSRGTLISGLVPDHFCSFCSVKEFCGCASPCCAELVEVSSKEEWRMADANYHSPARSGGEPVSLTESENESESWDLVTEVPGSPDQTIIDGWLKFRDAKK
ncbi:hypothetical protein J6590_101056, partial [Homalodisca vitripennis]